MSTYEEARWAYLSPKFREAHNRLRRARGQPPIPDPKIDLYVPRRGPPPTPFDPSSRDAVAAAREFLGPMWRGADSEGFSINGRPVNDAVPIQRPSSPDRQEAQRITNERSKKVADWLRKNPDDREEGFRINGRYVR